MKFLDRKGKNARAVTPLKKSELQNWLKAQDEQTRSWVKENGFSAASGKVLALPGKDGKVEKFLYGLDEETDIYSYSALPKNLPDSKDGYFIDRKMTKDEATLAAMGWAFGGYDFDRYKSNKSPNAAKTNKLVWPSAADKDAVKITVEAIFMIRDLINTPTNDMGPEHLEAAARALTKQFNAQSPKVIRGDDLLKENYPAIHAVGRASDKAPRLIDFTWGDKDAPKVTLVGKGVCFDTGGLNIKGGANMSLMKKDMGGAAHVLGLAQMIMAAGLPVRLRVMIPAVENNINENAFRPSDVIDTRKGISVEIGNTDAEGRLILADALAEACTEKPDLLIDFATLTGAARAALGPEIPPIFSNDDKTAKQLEEASERTQDPLHRMPLWKKYEAMLKSDIADINNSGGSFAGAITAALFLQKFVEKDINWVHIDTYGWNPTSKPGSPKGGEAYAIRASFDMIRKRFGSAKPQKTPAKKSRGKNAPKTPKTPKK
ncbi:MAG: leucyl aminopeptidase family protein [Micavibrio sp.]|nr:MAG: leucyl aminopeptidase family protein [Micavibrio sp.]